MTLVGGSVALTRRVLHPVFMRPWIVSLVMLPTSVLAVLFTTAYVGQAVCKGFGGYGLCSDNIIPGVIIAAFAFGLGHIAAITTFRYRRTWKSYGKGVAIASCVALLLVFVQPDRPNVIIACSLWVIWTSLYSLECLLKAPLLPKTPGA